MTEPAAQTDFDALAALLGRPTITQCENRKGARRETGRLLEAAFVDLASALGPDLSVEIGAHEASFSVRMKQRLPQLRALAFEANPYVYEKFVASPDGDLAAIDYRHAAICGNVGTVELFIPRGWEKGSFSRTNAISSLHTREGPKFDYEAVRVPSLTLDDAVDGITFVNAVAWIDVEGAQREVIQSGPRFLKAASAIYIELEVQPVWHGQSTADEISQFLALHGFVPLMRDNLARLQYNCVFIRGERRCLEVAWPVAAGFFGEIDRLTAA